MFYIILAILIFVFFYALFLDGKNKIDIKYDEESNYLDEDFTKNPRVIFKADKKKYHFKSAFIGIYIENNMNENITVDRNYEIEVLNDEDNKWYKLPVENIEDTSKKIVLKPKDSIYQNVFIDQYKNLKPCSLRIIKKVEIGENIEIYNTDISIHNKKAIKEAAKKEES